MGDAAENLGDGAPVARVLEMFRDHEHFCKAMLDAWVVVDEAGKIQRCNPLFSSLVGLRTRQILRTESLDQLLTLTVSGKSLRVVDLIRVPAPTRIDEVSGTAGDRQDLNLIIGIYPFAQDAGPVGAFLLIRDVTAETNLQDKYKDKATQSITDPLTGLFNRNYFVEYLQNQLTQLATFPESAPQRTISVIMLDIDHFKKINDVHGHQAGDAVLKDIADLMRKAFRKTDVVARYGGEEFLAILPGTDMDGALTAAEKLRTTVMNHRFEFDGTAIPVTISSGVAQIAIGFELGDQAIARADAALYYSKQNGRNRVSLHNGKGPVAPFIRQPAFIQPS